MSIRSAALGIFATRPITTQAVAADRAASGQSASGNDKFLANDTTFNKLGVNVEVSEALKNYGFVAPTLVQASFLLLPYTVGISHLN